MAEDELTEIEQEVIEDRLHLIDNEERHIDIDELLARMAEEGVIDEGDSRDPGPFTIDMVEAGSPKGDSR